MSDAIKTVGILGAGTIGASWAALFLACGYEVAVHDATPDAGEAFVRGYVKNAWPVLTDLGLVKGGADRISFHKQPEAVAERSDFIQESVPEVIAIKRALFTRVEPHLKPQAILASSASGLMVKEMQEGFKNPARFILAHPFNPPHLIPLVELLANDRTEAGVLEQAEAFYASAGRVTIRVRKEIPGHIANRLQAALWREAIHLVKEGVGTVEDVDKAVSAGPGLRWAVMGPTMIFNLAAAGHGLEMYCERYADSFHRWWDDMGEPRFTPDVRAMLSAGVAEEMHGRSLAEVARERDEIIVGILRASRAVRETKA